MTFILALAALAHASDLELVLAVPGRAPVMAVVQPATVGSTYRIEAPSPRGERHQVLATVDPPDAGGNWQISWRVVPADREDGPGPAVSDDAVSLVNFGSEVPARDSRECPASGARFRYDHRVVLACWVAAE